LFVKKGGELVGILGEDRQRQRLGELLLRVYNPNPNHDLFVPHDAAKLSKTDDTPSHRLSFRKTTSYILTH
jgi:hypothetical protein